MKTPHQTRPKTLGRRIVNAGGWSLFQVAGVQGLRLASNLVMTRLLVPEAFGLMAMVGTLMAGFALSTDIGIDRSIAREDDGDQVHFLRVAFVWKILRGILIALGAVLAAILLWLFGPSLAPVGSVYADPVLPQLVALSAIMPFLMGFESANRDLAARNLQMKAIALVEVGAQVVMLCAMILFAMLSPTVWALMAGMLTGAAVKSLATHLFFEGPSMKLEWDTEIGSRIWHYGKWLLGSSVFSFIAQSAGQFILAALLSTATFGIFTIAQVWVGAGTMVITRLSNRVGFPAVSEMIRTRPTEVARLFRKFQTVIDALCLTGFVFLLFGGEALIKFFYTPVYEEAGTYLAILSVGFLAVRFNTLNGLIMNLGKSREMMLISVTRAISICVFLPLAFNTFGLRGALIVVAINPLVTTAYTLKLLKPVLGAKQIRFDYCWLIFNLAAAGGVFWWTA